MKAVSVLVEVIEARRNDKKTLKKKTVDKYTT